MTPAEYIRRKRIHDVALTSEQVEAMTQQFREEAAWIVGQEEARVIQAYYDVAAGIADGSLSPAEARRMVREALDEAGYMSDEPGSLNDLRDGTARQKRILDTNIKKAAGYAWHETIKGSLAFPAQELVRYGARRVPRDWQARWREAWSELPAEEQEKALPGPRMVALTDCAIWRAISRWHDPYPPFDYGSGMDVDAVGYEETVRLGLLKEDEGLPVYGKPEEEVAPFTSEPHQLPQSRNIPPRIMALLEKWIATKRKGGRK